MSLLKWLVCKNDQLDLKFAQLMFLKIKLTIFEDLKMVINRFRSAPQDYSQTNPWKNLNNFLSKILLDFNSTACCCKTNIFLAFHIFLNLWLPE